MPASAVVMPSWDESDRRTALRESMASVASVPATVALTTAVLAVANCPSSELTAATAVAMPLSAPSRTLCTVAAAVLRLAASAFATVTAAAPSVPSEGEAAYWPSASESLPISVAGEVSLAVPSADVVVDRPSVCSNWSRPPDSAAAEAEPALADRRLARSASSVALRTPASLTPPLCVVSTWPVLVE